MGVPKHTLIERQRQVSLLEHQLQRFAPSFAETLLLAGGHNIEIAHQVRVLPDVEPWSGQGPLGGLLAAFRHASFEWVAVLPVDQPLATPALYKHALKHCYCEESTDAVLYLDSQSEPQWLCGMYHRRLAEKLTESLNSGNRAVKRFTKELTVVYLEPPTAGVFNTMNTLPQAAELGFEPPGS